MFVLFLWIVANFVVCVSDFFLGGGVFVGIFEPCCFY